MWAHEEDDLLVCSVQLLSFDSSENKGSNNI